MLYVLITSRWILIIAKRNIGNDIDSIDWYLEINSLEIVVSLSLCLL